MITKEQYNKLTAVISARKCPICNSRTIMQCIQDKTQIYFDDQYYIDTPNILNDEYLELECANCSYVMKFHIKNLIK